MKIATFNINNINRRLSNLVAWLKSARPDIVCLQELKCETNAFPAASIQQAGYHAVWHGQRTWNGVAILSKDEPVLVRRSLPGDKADTQSRYIEAAIAGIIVGCIYAPNGNPQPGPKFDYKLAWLDRLIKHGRELMREDVPTILAGDYNIVPDLAIDLYPTRSWDKDALTQPQPRARYETLLQDGWLDAVRARHPDKRVYTFWDYKRQRWARDAGLRLDHLLVSHHWADRIVSAGVDKSTRGEEGASDHAPAWIELAQKRLSMKGRARRVPLTRKGRVPTVSA